MILRILGTDEEKEKALKLLQNGKVAFDFPATIPEGTKPENLLLWPRSGKGESKFENS